MAAVLAVTPGEAPAAVADLFTPGPRVDLAVEIDYRVSFPTADQMLRADVPADRVGRERVEEARTRVARAYMRGFTDAVVDFALDRIPLAAYLERRYDELTTFRFRSRSDAGGPAPAPGAAALAAPFLRARPRPGPDDALTVRLRLDAAEAASFAPGVEVKRGPLDCRFAYSVSRDRLEVTLSRQLTGPVRLELTGSEAFSGSDGTRLQLSIRVPF